MQTRKVVPQLEAHIINACNLTCEWCSHYSNFRQPAEVCSARSLEEEWRPWSRVISPARFIVLGGEPTLNRELTAIMQLACQLWSFSVIELVTNGHRLEHFHDLIPLLRHRGLINLSLHKRESSQQLVDKLEPFKRGGVRTRVFQPGVSWVRFYEDVNDPKPFDDRDPAASWSVCPSRHCHVLRDGKLWKCPPVAFHHTIGLKWEHFNSYEPCSIDDDLDAWFDLKHEMCCSHCPASLQTVPLGENL